MRYMFHILFLFILSCLQGTVGNTLSFFGVSANFFIIYVSVICFLAYKTEGIVTSAVFGFILDIITGRFIGIYTVLFIISAFFITTLSEKVFNEPRFYLSMLITLSVSVFINVFYYITTFLILGGFDFKFASKVILIEGIYDTLLSVPVYFILKRITQNFYSDKGEYIE